MNIWQALVKLVEALDRHQRPWFVLGLTGIVGLVWIAATLVPALTVIALRQLWN